MSKRKKFPIIFALVGTLMLACNLATPTPSPDLNTDNLYTQAAQTVVVELTQQAPPSPTPTPIVVVPDVTLEPTATVTSLPTYTPTSTVTQPPPICDAIQFVDDVSVRDGTPFTPGSKFTKTWRLKNVGQCTWTSQYDLIFVRGDKIGAQATIPLGVNVVPGQTVDLYVNMEAPDKAGSYKGYWLLRNSEGIAFGLGGKVDNPFWVSIEVVAANDDYRYDFAINYCQAVWQTNLDTQLPCPGTIDAPQGFVTLTTDPLLENKRENEPTLLAHPSSSADGWIRGIYPEFKVRNGDRFVAWVGCMDESNGCNVVFKLQYRIDGGKPETLGTWAEKYDGDVTKIDLDLSSLAGETVQFILRVNINGGKPANADAFWFVPHIQR